MNNNENTWDQLLKISTGGRDETNADEYRHPYEPTPYSVLDRLAGSGMIRRGDAVLDYGCGKGRVGFFLSYRTKATVTGIEYEPWHNRYVGAPHASIIMNSGITLEEYIELLTPGVWYVSGEYLISRRASDDLHLPNGWTTCDISSDNTGYFIVTLRMG